MVTTAIPPWRKTWKDVDGLDEPGHDGESCGRKLSCIHHAQMQPAVCVERGEDRAFLPCRDPGGVLAGQHDAAVDPAQIVVMLRPRGVAPVAGAAERERHP